MVIKFIYSISFSKIRNNIYCYVFNTLEKYSYSYFQDNLSGSVGNRVLRVADASEKLLYNFFDAIIAKWFIKVAMLCCMYKIHASLFFVDISWFALYVALTVFANSREMNRIATFEEEKNLLGGKIVDSFDNILNVKSFANKKYERELIFEQTKSVYSRERELYRAKMLYEGIRTLFSSPLLLVNIFLSIGLYGRKLITLGDISFIVTMSYSLVKSMKYFNEEIAIITDQYGIVKQCLETINKPFDVRDKSGARKLNISRGTIEIKDISFQYKSNSFPIFSNFNLSIESRSKIGIVGYSGSGKSTLVNLLLRFYDVTDGSICIDGQNVKEVTQESLRQSITYIPQDPILFNRTIGDNILYGRLDASRVELIEAAREACCYDFISNLEKGFDTLVGERGVKLSGGQRQRVAMARALLKNSEILILDEPTAALDSVTEKEIQMALNNLMKNKTVVVIAHRLSTLSMMDRILVIDNGKITGDGIWESLLKNSDIFAKMWSMQKGGVIGETVEFPQG
jgi:ATP-binding cassette subfamily B protein